MDFSHTLIVTDADQEMRLDKFLALHLPSLSRTRLANLIAEGFVKVDGKSGLAISSKMKEGQKVSLTLPPLKDPLPTPQEIPLEILYEDEELIVINKPSGLVVHPAPGNYTGTLVNALLYHCGDSLSGINGIKRPGIVHRLDKDTSGVLVAAKTDKAHHQLAAQLSDHSMHRVYQAIVWGKLFPPAGTLEGSIGRDPHHRQRMTIRQGGKFARTHYKVLKNFGSLASLVECRLETGRTHQIRVHLTAKGHPLIGDPVYKKAPPPNLTLTKAIGRQALHAKELSFIHPKTKEPLQFSTDLPADMDALIQALTQLRET